MKSLFQSGGVHCLVDGQFGSTGKGALGAYLAHKALEQDANFMGVISNAGPNSGHTFWVGDEKVVLKQLPSFAVYQYMVNRAMAPHFIYMDAGAIIDPEIFYREARMVPNMKIYLDPQATIVLQKDKDAEGSGTVQAVAGTRSGAGAALARKVLRDPTAVAKDYYRVSILPVNVEIGRPKSLDWCRDRFFMEVSQGFSLGIHSDFYPKVTSRECTAMQGLADARLPAKSLAQTYMVVRTFPIRVGNHEGFSSGDHYHDQEETSWEKLGVDQERTTVTNRVRRVFTFSEQQYLEAFAANEPDFVLVNFLNYLTEEAQGYLLDRIRALTPAYAGLLGGYGPKVGDIEPL